MNRIFSRRSLTRPNEHKKLSCKMIVLLKQVLHLLDTEPNPEILKEQSLYLIDYIQECCDCCRKYSNN